MRITLGADAQTIEAIRSPRHDNRPRRGHMNYIIRSREQWFGWLLFCEYFDLATDPNIDQVLTHCAMPRPTPICPPDVRNF